MLFHSYFIGGLGETFAPLEQSGWMGVDLFFVLSGYLIGRQVLSAMKATHTVDLRLFYLRRATRILPAFFTVLALYALWPAWRETPLMQPLWQFPTFTSNLLFDAPDHYAFSHVWSLCVEEHFYLVFPFAALWFARRASAARFITLCLGLLFGGMLLRAWLWTTFVAPLVAADTAVGPAYLRYLYYPTYARLDGLLAGVILAACVVYRPLWMQRARAHAGWVAMAAAGLLAGSLWLFAGQRAAFWPNVVGYPLLAMGMAGFVALAGGGTWLARSKVPGAGWVARASYSLYLSHKGVFTLTAAALGGSLQDHPLARFTVFALATLAGGAVLHYAVEGPVMRWRDRQSATLSPPKVIHDARVAD